MPRLSGYATQIRSLFSPCGNSFADHLRPLILICVRTLYWRIRGYPTVIATMGQKTTPGYIPIAKVRVRTLEVSQAYRNQWYINQIGHMW
jgi:hypothetical protein